MPQPKLTASPIGHATPRVDGPLKVTERRSTPRTSTFPDYCMPFRSRRRSPAAKLPSSTPRQRRRCPAYVRFFIAKISEKSFVRPWGRILPASASSDGRPFEDDVVRYYGQYVALAVADTFETAKAAADAVVVTYSKEKPNVEARTQSRG